MGFLALDNYVSSKSGCSRSRKAQETKVEPTPTSATSTENKDGEILSKLALQKQEQELDALNGKPKPERDEEPEKPKSEVKEKDKTDKKPVAKTPEYKPKPPQPRYQPQPRRVAETPPPPRRIVQVPSPAPPREIRQARTPLPPPPSFSREAFKPQQVKATDPLVELERLRALGNVGRVDYAQQQSSPKPNLIAANSPTPEDTSSAELTPSRSSRRRSNRRNNTEQPINTDNNNIEQLRPRWSPTETEENTASSSAKNVSFSEEEAILQERKPQYLVVGEYAKATLNTPLLIPQGSDKEQTSNLRFVATLTEPLKGNTNEIAIEAGTEIVISVVSVDNSSNMKAEVTAILKDGTEYPISPGTISVLGKEGSPLIARPHNDKGDEIAGYDATLGMISGLAKVGEIINKPDEEVTEDLPLGGSRTRTRNNNRNPTGAFIEGFFGSVSEVVGKRTERATQEILSRPNIWVVPKNTEITIQVNRSIKL